MRVAERMKNLRAEGAYAVLNRATELERQGKNIIHFEIGQPDFPTPKNISDAGINAILEGKTKYTPPLGIMPLREKIAENLDVRPENIAITPSGKTAIFAGMALVVNPGDEVIYPDPGFPTYHSLVDFFGGVKKPVPLLEETGFSFDMDAFRKQFSDKTKLVILNSPSNPTGGIIPQKDLEEIASIIDGTDAYVITDEMYSTIVYGDSFPSFYKLPIKNKILVDGFSKKFSMTGWRIGYLGIPSELTAQMDYLLTHMVGCTATPTQWAVLEGLNGPKEPLDKMVEEFRRRRNFVVGELNKIEGVNCQIPEGAFYAFPNIKEFGRSSKEIAGYLLDNGVALLDGTSFGENGEGYLRLSYATSMDNLTEGIKRIKSSLSKL